MRAFGRQNTLTKWARLALKAGLVMTDTKLWASISDQLRDRADYVGDRMKRRYEETMDRLEDARHALRRRGSWVGPTVNFLGGVGIGVGLGILFAPVSGEEARAAVRDRVVDIKNRVSDLAVGGVRIRESTGTHGD